MDSKTALIVIDLQNDYLWDKRKKMFGYDTESLISSVNRAVHTVSEKGGDVIYIAQMFPDIITNRWFIGFSIKGTEGAELFGKLDIVSGLYFEKNLPDSYTAKAFRRHMEEKKYTEVLLCGLDECGCVGATARGAVKTGVKVSIIENCTACRFSKEKQQKMRRKLNKLGVGYMNL